MRPFCFHETPVHGSWRSRMLTATSSLPYTSGGLTRTADGFGVTDRGCGSIGCDRSAACIVTGAKGSKVGRR